MSASGPSGPLVSKSTTVKPVLNGHSKRRPKIDLKDRLLLNAGHIAERSKVIQNAPKRAFCNIFTFIKLQFVFKTFVLSILERL